MPQGNQTVDTGKFFIENFQLTIALGMIEIKYCHFTTPTEIMDLSSKHQSFVKLFGKRLKGNFFNKLIRLATLESINQV